MVNTTVFQGRFVDNPVFGDTNAGVKYANFRMAWSEKYKERENKCFLECKAFGATASFMEKYFNTKGQELVAVGKLTTDEWEKDGQKRSKTVLLVDNVHFCGSKKQGDSSEQEDPAMPSPFETDSLPF